jgi:5'-phosphate synthase pdxT subunit
MTVGVLALQGDVREHSAALADLGEPVRHIRTPEDLPGLDGLVIPGGESTTLSMLVQSSGLFEPLAALLDGGLPVFGTCAGMILLAEELLDGRSDQRGFGLIDLTVRRNGYGRQVASFETDLEFGEGPPLPAVFIRAPLIVSVGGSVDVLASLDGAPVLVRQGSIVASVFHPELTADRRVHRIFVDLVDRAA